MSLHRVLTGAPRSTPATYREHIAQFGELPRTLDITKELLSSGLTGHGGAAFPTGKKVELLKNQRHGVQFVVVNAMEGEPASMKDRVLLSTNPHLVIDGAVALANTLDADQVIVCVPRDRPKLAAIVQRAIDERPTRARRDARIELQTPPGRYVAGEESALVHWLNDKETLPQYRPTRPAILTIGRSATLVDNAETCAHVALIARYGAEWFRQVGTTHRPGTTVVTVSGAAKPAVTEVPYGTPIIDIIRECGVINNPQAFLLAGFGGVWIDGAEAHRGFDDDSLRPIKATTGAGIVVALPLNACGIRETARIVRWMAGESARQCGPCAFGLPALADDLELLASGRRAEQTLSRLQSRASVMEGRGACRHPDGVVRLVRSALEVFATDAVRHANGNPCLHAQSTVVHVPVTQREEELEWQ